MTPAGTIYSREQTERWLSWMARHLRRQGRTIFLLERIDETWLGSHARKLLYLGIFAVVFTLTVGSVLWAFDELSVQLDSRSGACEEEQDAVAWSFWWLGTFLWASTAGVLTWFRPGWLPSSWLRLDPGRWWSAVVDLTAYWLIWIGIWGMMYLTGCGELGRPVLIGLMTVVVYGFRYGLSHIRRVPTVEKLAWSWMQAFSGLFYGLLIGAAVWVVYWLDWRDCVSDTWRHLGLYLPIAGVSGFLARGLCMQIVEKSRPNEGTRRSLDNALRAGALIGPVVGLVCWPAFHFTLGDDSGELSAAEGAVLFGALGAVIAALWFGGMDFLRHWMLRLALTGVAPRRWKKFLKYAAGIGLLRRAGGGFMFIHRFVLDHFADRESVATGS